MQTLSIVRVLVSDGYKVTVCCYHEHVPNVVEMFRSVGADVMLLQWERPRNTLSLLGLIFRLASVFRKLHPGIVHVQYMAPGFVAVLAARFSGARVVFATVHQPGRTYGFKERLLLQAAARLCAAFQCISLSVEESWFGNSNLFDPANPLKKRHFTLYNAVDTKEIAHCVDSARREGLRQQLGLQETPVIGCIGRLRGEKGQMYLVEAMEQVVRQLPTVKLLLIGDGPDREAIFEKIENLKLKDSVRWLGAMQRIDAMRHLAAIDVMAVPSLFEGFGLVAAEAMAAGIPVVASNVDGLAEVVIQGETGILVPPGVSNVLAEALIALLADSEVYSQYSRNSIRRVEENFSTESFSEILSSVYKIYSVG